MNLIDFKSVLNIVSKKVRPKSTEISQACLQNDHPIYRDRVGSIGKLRKIPLGGGHGKRGNVLVGRWSYYGDSIFQGFHESDLLVIGNFCSIAADVNFFLCKGHHFPERVTTYPVDIFFGKPVNEVHPNITQIGHDVWIGSKSIIMPGIKIGNGAIIGAGSVVTKDVDPYSIVVGNPAKQIRWRIQEESVRERLQAVGWWDWTDQEIFDRCEWFKLGPEDAIELADKQGWIKAEGVPSSYLSEVNEFFPNVSSPDILEAKVRDFLYTSSVAGRLFEIKSLSYENLIVWMAALLMVRPKCIVEFGTQTGCSSSIIAKMCRYCGLNTRIVTINIVDELKFKEEGVEYLISDFTGRMRDVWKMWNPDIIFQDAHMYHLVDQQISEGCKHTNTLHLFHDVGFRLFKNPMQIPLDAVPTGATGSWERHVLAKYSSEDLLKVCNRKYEDDKLQIHIFDGTANSREYGIAALRFK